MGAKYGRMYPHSKKGLMEGMKLTKMFCAFMSRFATATVMCFCIVFSLAAGTLELDVDIVAGASEIESGTTVNNVYFVFDRSGSMKKGRFNGKICNEAMLDTFRERLEVIPRDANVYYLTFSDTIGAVKGPFPVGTDREKELLFKKVRSEPIGNMTLLYDAQAAMVNKIRADIEKESQMKRRVNAEMWDYTDGWNQTDKLECKFRSHWLKYECVTDEVTGARRYKWNRLVHEEKGDRHFRYKAEVKRAHDEFERSISDLREQYKDCVTIERQFLSNHDELPDMGEWGRKTIFRPIFKGDFSKIASPLAQDSQVARCSFRFPMPTRRWNELKGRSALLCLKYGNTKRSAQLSFKEGLTRIKFDLSGITGEHPTEAELTLEKLPSPNEFKDFELKEPRPLRFVFPKIGTVMLSDIEPGLKFVRRVDEPIKFSAKCSDGVSPLWSFSDNTVKEGTSFVKSFNVASNYTFEVVATNKNLNPCKLKGDIQIIEAAVAIWPPSESVIVDKQVRFVAEAKGTAHSFDWSVDGIPVTGDGKVLAYVFAKSGDHKVQVHARYDNVGLVASPVLLVSVKTAPRIGIQSPTAYSDEFVTEEEIKLVAEVEGGLDRVVWTLKGPEQVTLESPVVRGDAQSVYKTSSAVVRVHKSGVYEISAKALGEGLEKKAQSVQITVKRADVGIDIKLPIEGHEVENGKEESFEAKVTGPEIGKVSWYAVDEKGTTIDIGLSDVEKDGKSRRAFVFPQTVGKTALKIYAKGLNAEGKELSESVVSAPREVLAFTPGSVDIDMKENFARVPYGEQRVLTAKPSGAVSAVFWFMIEDGKETPIGSGNDIQTPIVKPDGKTPERTIDYFARGKMPDGSFVPKDPKPITLIHYCPPVAAVIELPMDKASGMPLASIGRTVDYTVQLKSANDIMNIIWDWDDGVAYTNDNLKTVTHAYTNYGTYTIKVSGKCVKCGEAFKIKAPSAVVVEKQPISAEFVIRPSAASSKVISGSIAQWRQVALVGKDTPDIQRHEWTCNGVVILDDDGKPVTKHKVEFRCWDVGENVFGHKVFDENGNAFGPEMHKLRVYRLWVILIICVVCAIIWMVLVLYWRNDDLRFWSVMVRIDENRDTPFDELSTKQNCPKEIVLADNDKWDVASNLAVYSMGELTEDVSGAGNWQNFPLRDEKVIISPIIRNLKLHATVVSFSKLIEVTPDLVVEDVFRVTSFSAEDRPVVLELVRAIADKSHFMYMVISFVVLFLIAIGLSVWLAF